MEEKDINRLLLRYEQIYKKSNREIINPEIETLAIDDLEPIIRMVAQSRASYLKHVYELSKKHEAENDPPSAEELKKLKTLRLRFEELAEGAKAFETSIQRGYLDLKTE
jgi:hypothetical protein